MIYKNKQDVIKYINESQLKNNDLVFSSMKFNQFNEGKCDGLYIHVHKKLSLIFGIKGCVLSAPFSAPFSFVRYASDYVKYSQVLDFFVSLIEVVDGDDNISEVKITLPPYIYNQSMLTKVSLALGNSGFNIAYRDINSHFDLKNFCIDKLPSVTKKAIRANSNYANEFLVAETQSEKILAYNIIKQNRDMKGYPLRMSLEQVLDTAKNAVNSYFFISKVDSVPAAAAIVFEVSHDVVQVIYWGANELGERCSAMYFLPFKVLDFFKSINKMIVDIGPSSEYGVISNGLNDYKQMIGCDNSVKETWVYKK